MKTIYTMMQSVVFGLVLLSVFSFQIIRQDEGNTADLKESEGFVITGKIKGLPDAYIYLAHQENGVNKVDSCLLRRGSFKFRGKVAEPEMVFLHTKKRTLQKVFYAENVPMKISGNAAALDKITVTGSRTQDDFARLESQVNAHRAKVIEKYQKAEAMKNAGDSLGAKVILLEADDLYRAEAGIRKKFILDNPKSPVSMQELLNWANEQNYTEARSIYLGLDPSLHASKKGKEVALRLDNLESVQIGKQFKDFTQKDINGNSVSLSSYNGKYVLVEFWASWCGPCRAENPNLREAYLKYKDKGLNILGVSLDEDVTRWKKAMEKDSLPWTQVSDLKGWNNEAAVQYGVRAIPANFLIDPNGKIVMRNLRGEELNKELESLFK